jgi:glucose/arabinose dehydrogenase
MSMQPRVMRVFGVSVVSVASAVLLIARVGSARDAAPGAAAAGASANSCPNAGLKLPPGFCASVLADQLGHSRHLVVAGNGVVYANTWSGRYYGNQSSPAGGFLIALQDTTGGGKADVIRRFGPTAAQGGKGGTGIALYRDGLYVEESDRIERYALSPDARADLSRELSRRCRLGRQCCLHAVSTAGRPGRLAEHGQCGAARGRARACRRLRRTAAGSGGVVTARGRAR